MMQNPRQKQAPATFHTKKNPTGSSGILPGDGGRFAGSGGQNRFEPWENHGSADEGQRLTKPCTNLGGSEQLRTDVSTSGLSTLPLLPGCFTEGDADAWAVFSDDRRYRYLLGRQWDAARRPVLWILTNPSKAGAFVSDQTVVVGAQFSRRNGFGGMIFANLKAFIATDPRDLEEALANGADVVGPQNEAAINAALLRSGGAVIVAWGANGYVLGLDHFCLKRLRARGIGPLCLGTTKDGAPRHPLRLAYTTPLEPA